MWKSAFQIIYIYKLTKRCGKSFQKIIYIYDMAKSVGKMLEIQTHNYRQLQMWIKWIKVWIKCG